MHPLDVAILEAFKQDPAKSFSTTELVRSIFKQEFAALNPQLHNSEKKEQRSGFAKKAKLHRKLLYHINGLVAQRLLLVHGTRGKGEKVFRLNLDEGELIIQEKKRKIVIAKPASLATQIDGYEQQGLIRKYRPESWLNKQNAIMLDGNAFASVQSLQQRCQQLFPAINDTLAILGFEAIVARAAPEDVDRFLQYLLLDARDYDVTVSLLVSVAGIDDAPRLLRAIGPLIGQEQRHLTFVFGVTPRLLTRRDAFFRELFTLFSERRVKLTLKNSAISTPPIFFGRAGAYALTQEEWETYKTVIRPKADGCVVAQASVAIDIDHFLQGKGSAAQFREMAMRSAHAFFEVSERKRRQYGPLLDTIAPTNGRKEFFKLGKDYIRFWNYDWAQQEYPIIDLLTSASEEVEKFCVAQETIFRSCGMPIRFSVGLSTSFAKFDQDFLSERRYTKTVVASLADLQTKEMTNYLRARERLFKAFQGADRLRFFFAKGTPTEESLQMARYLLRAYDLPTFTFDFRGKSGELKLTGFLEES